ncbi:MAG: type II secretion system F family protein [Candidatus Omnitrophica bacterium]|nr:type II secretion system F family protein [Candidatus Omnitrophota bacterium]
MPQYAYRAKRDVATEAQGIVEAQDLSGAIKALRSQGLFPLEVHPLTSEKQKTPSPGIDSAPISPAGIRPLRAAEASLWARTLAQGLHGGLTLVQSLHLLSEQEKGRPLGELAIKLGGHVVQGQPLSQGMGSTGVYSPVTVAMVQAGEFSGSLEQALLRIADASERSAELRGKILSAIAYPSLILTVGFLTTCILVIWVVPQLAKLFVELGQPLPWPTRMMLSLRSVLGFVIAGLIAAAIGIRVAIRNFERRLMLKRRMFRVLEKLPVLGRVIFTAQLASWTRTLGLMLQQGVSLPEAVRLSNKTLEDPALQKQLLRTETDVLEGVSLSDSLRRAGIAAPLLVTMTAIGEAEGAMDQSLLSVASSYERDVDQGVKVASSLMEPLLILAVGIVVAGIVFSMLLPIFDINFTVS